MLDLLLLLLLLPALVCHTWASRATADGASITAFKSAGGKGTRSNRVQLNSVWQQSNFNYY
jgi:hypothetical protein